MLSGHIACSKIINQNKMDIVFITLIHLDLFCNSNYCNSDPVMLATGMSATCNYGTIDDDDTSRQVNIPEKKPKRQDSGKSW